MRLCLTLPNYHRYVMRVVDQDLAANKATLEVVALMTDRDVIILVILCSLCIHPVEQTRPHPFPPAAEAAQGGLLSD